MMNETNKNAVRMATRLIAGIAGSLASEFGPDIVRIAFLNIVDEPVFWKMMTDKRFVETIGDYADMIFNEENSANEENTADEKMLVDVYRLSPDTDEN